jgi:hypothetical protein
LKSSNFFAKNLPTKQGPGLDDGGFFPFED